MPALFRTISLSLLGALLAAASAAQPREAPPIPGLEAELTSNQDPEGFRAGPLYVKPYLRIGGLGLDTNVFYTPSDRQSDFFASGGPGLKLTLPVRRLRFTLDGNLDYYYFARTTGQRKLGGRGSGKVEYVGNVFRAGVERGYSLEWRRPSLEIDQRVLQETWSTRAYLDVGKSVGGRLRLAPIFSADRNELTDGKDYLGNDLNRNLSRDTYRFGLGLSYRLTGKTHFVAGADHQLDRFLEDDGRDADSNRIVAGFRLESKTRLSGHVVGGVRLFRPKADARGGRRQDPYWDVDLRYAFGARTSLRAGFTQDLSFSALQTAGSPVLLTRVYTARLHRDVTQKIDLNLFGRLQQLDGQGTNVIVGSDGELRVVRNDDNYEYGGDLGYTFRRLRIGMTAAYQERRSNFADFGIRGLLLGATIVYNP